MTKSTNLEDRVFGRLKVLSKSIKRSKWLCICECGNKKEINSSSLIRGKTRSCGCLRKEQLSNRAKTHGESGSRLYQLWVGMRQRCNNPNRFGYDDYGGRGIRVCEEWNDFSLFRAWAYNQPEYENEKSLERIDVNKGYNPENCKWIDLSFQSKNKRNSLKNGDELWLDTALRNGITWNAFYKRVRRGWSFQKAATEPLKSSKQTDSPKD